MTVETQDKTVDSHGGRPALLRRVDWVGVAFIAPAILVVALLLVYPLGTSLYYSMTSKHLIKKSYDFVAFENFAQLLSDKQFWAAFFTSIKWTFASIFGQLGLGFLLAMALDKIKHGSALFRTLLIMPWAVPPIILAFAWKWLLNDVNGFLPNLLQIVQITDGRISLLANPTTAFWTVLFINIWFGTPLFMVNILSALKTIPAEQMEAATVDGASIWQRFNHITLHHIRTVIGLLVILRTIWVFNNFDMLFLLTGGGPGDITTTVPIYAYRVGWGLKQLGMASAITILLLVFLMLVSIGLFRLLSKWEREDS